MEGVSGSPSRIILNNVLSKDHDLLCVYKPSGINTHRSDYGRVGLLEILEDELRTQLFVVHRLDQETSGLMLFAKNKETTQKLAEEWENGRVQKVYHFLTSSPSKKKNFTVKSAIKKVKNFFVSDGSSPSNSETHFEWLRNEAGIHLWRARPATGKPHQIRLHARDAEIPILGDTLYGGQASNRVYLSADSLHIPALDLELHLESFIKNFSKPDLLPLEEAREKMQRFLSSPPTGSCYRFSHNESREYRVDVYGEQAWIYWYGDQSPETLVFDIVKTLKLPAYVREMKTSRPPAAIPYESTSPRLHWRAQEQGVNYELRADQGNSPGLFLDQEENRLWVRNHSDGLDVLNLFCYTSGFSVCAALGGARSVTSVDVSKNFINWSKKNFELNGLNPENYEFWVQDSVVFLEACKKRNRKFDLILCDPPTLGRSKFSTFDLKKDVQVLVRLCLDSLSPRGVLQFSCNYEAWSLRDLKQKITATFADEVFRVEVPKKFNLRFDLDPDKSLMKTLRIQKE